MGWMDSIKEFLSKRELPAVLGVSLDAPHNILTYGKIKEIIECLNDYLSEIKRLPRSLSELVRVSNNFCNRVIKVLMEYREIMVSYEDFTNCSGYKLKLLEILGRLEKECENKSVLRFKVEEYEDIFGDGDSNKRGENSHLIGDFAKSLGDAAQCTCNTIGGYVGDYRGLTEYLGINNLSSVRKFIARFKSNVKNPLAGAVSSARQGAKRLFSNMFLVEEVEPIEYFKFDESGFLGRSTVHGVSNIMNSYKKILKNYPKELINYVNSCLDCIEKIDALLKSYLKFLEVFMSPKRTRIDEIKAKQGMENELDELSRLIEKSLKNECIFCLKEIGPEGRLLNALEFKYNEKRDQWFNSELQDIGGGFFENVCKRNGTKIVLRGWSLGHFLCKFKPVVEHTKAKLNDLINFESNKINYEELEIKEPKSDKKPESSRSKVKDIAEMVKKADALKKRIRALWTQVQELAESKKFKSSDNAKKYGKIFGKNGSYDRFLEEYDKLVMSSVKDKVVDGSGKNVLDEDNALKECSSHFSVMNKHAQEIEKTCKSWIDFYGKDASIGKKKKEAEQNRILDNIKLFKRRFSKFFNEASDLAKKVEKEFNSVMELNETDADADADLLKTYKQTMNAEYQKLKESFTFSFPFLEGTLVIFDYNGFNEDNLYSWIKHVYYYIENILIYEARNFKEWLSKLKQNFEEFDAEYEEAIYLFGKKKDIDEMVKKADALKKRIEMLYTKVQELKMSVFFKYAYSNKTSDIGKSYNKLFDKGGCYDNFLKAHQSFLEASSKVKTNAGEALQGCTEHFSKMSKNAREIEKTCKRWIDYCGKDAFRSKKETEAAQKRIVDDFELLKRRFFKAFNESKDLAKKSEKELNSVMNLEATGADDDLLATYKQTLMNKYSELIKSFTFSYGGVLIFDYDGFKEENLYYCCIRHSKYFSIDLQKKFDKLKQNFERFNAECEEVIKLFGKKNKGNLQELSKTFNGLVKTLEKAIKDYKSAEELNKEFKEKYKDKEIYKKFKNDKRVQNYSSFVANFESAWKSISSEYKKLWLEENGAVIKDNKVILENVRAISKDSAETTIENENKRKQCDKLTQNIQSRLIGMREVFGKIKDLTDVIAKIIEENSANLRKALANARGSYTEAENLNTEFEGFSGKEKFGKAFTRNGSVKWFEQCWIQIKDEQSKKLKDMSGIDISGEVPSAEVVSSISADQKKAGEVTKVLEDITSYCKDMHGYFKEIEKLVEDLAREKSEISEVLTGAIENYKAIEALHNEYSQLYGWAEGVFSKDTSVEEFRKRYEISKEKIGELIELAYLRKSNHDYEPDETGILNMLFDYTKNNFEKYNECEAISKEIESNLKEMQKLIEPIRELSEKLKKVSDRLDEKDEGSDWFQILVNEYEAYNGASLTELVDKCEKCAKEDLGIGIPVKTPLEKCMKRDKTGGAGRWEDLKKLYNDTIAEYDKSKKALEEAIKKLGYNVESIKKGWHKKFDEAGLEVMKGRVGKVEYTSSEDISKRLEDFVEKVKEEKKKFKESEEAKKQ